MAKYVRLEIEVNEAELDALKHCIDIHYVDTAISYSVGQFGSEHHTSRSPASDFDKDELQSMLDWQRNMFISAIIQAERRLKHER